MLDFADMIVLNKFEKRGAEDALRDVRKQWRRNHPDQIETAGRGDPGFPDHRQPLQRSGREPPVPGAVRARSITRAASGPLDAARDGAPLAVRAHRIPFARSADSRGARRVTSPRSPAQGREARAPADARAAAAQRAHGLYLSLQAAGRPPLCRHRWRRARDSPPATASTRCAPPTTARWRRSAARRWPRCAAWPQRQQAHHRAGILVHRARPRGARRQLLRVAEPQPDSEAGAAAARRLGRDPALPAEREPARRLSVHRRRVSVPARGRRSDAHVRGRRRAGTHQSPLSLSRRGSRGHAAVDGLRLDHAVRRGSGPASGHLRPHRQFRRVHRHAR